MWVLKNFCQNSQFCTTFLVVNITFDSTFIYYFENLIRCPAKKHKGVKIDLLGDFYLKNSYMTSFHGLGHGNRVLRYVGGFPELRELDFRGLKGQFNVKKANIRGLIAKIGYLRPILTSRIYLQPIFRDYVTRIVP